MKKQNSNYGVNIILYPRSYNKRGSENLHSVQGMTSDGRIVNVKLRVQDSSSEKDNYPSILEFSRTDAKATQSCFSSPDNSYENREGVLLFSQATSEGVNASGMESYIAKWASVLSPRSESPDPIIEMGRVDIRKNKTLLKSLNQRLLYATENKNEELIEQLKLEIDNPANFSFSLVTYHYDAITSEYSNNLNELRNKVMASYSKNRIHGAVPGFFVRALNAEGRIIHNSYLEYFAKYNTLEEKYQSIAEMVDHFIDVVEPSLEFSYFGDPNTTIEFCPLSKIVTGRLGRKHFGAQYKYKFLRRMFYSNKADDNDNVVLCNVAAKMSVYDDKSLLSRVYPISHQLGDPKRLDSHGRFTKIFEDENAKLSQESVSHDDLIPRDIGLSYKDMPLRSTWIIYGSSAPLATSESPDIKSEDTTKLKETAINTIPLREDVVFSYDKKEDPIDANDDVIEDASERTPVEANDNVIKDASELTPVEANDDVIEDASELTPVEANDAVIEDTSEPTSEALNNESNADLINTKESTKDLGIATIEADYASPEEYSDFNPKEKELNNQVRTFPGMEESEELSELDLMKAVEIAQRSEEPELVARTDEALAEPEPENKVREDLSNLVLENNKEQPKKEKKKKLTGMAAFIQKKKMSNK